MFRSNFLTYCTIDDCFDPWAKIDFDVWVQCGEQVDDTVGRIVDATEERNK